MGPLELLTQALWPLSAPRLAIKDGAILDIAAEGFCVARKPGRVR